mgnify:FL=1
MKVGIFGCGAYGLALSSILYENNCELIMWTKFAEEKENLEKQRKNEVLLPNYILPNEVKLTTNVAECIKDSDLLIIAIPTAFVSGLTKEMAPYIKNHHILIASKGIEKRNGQLISEILEENLDTSNIAVISGPTFAKDLISKMPAGLTLASKSKETMQIVKAALQNKYLKLRCTDDIIGVEICGAIKNVIAISSGILSSLGANESSTAMLLTEAAYDMQSILKALGGEKSTVLSYAGFGDLLMTCTSKKSRNYNYGILVGKKVPTNELEEYLKNNTVEGYYTLISIYETLNNKNITIPIIDLIYDIVMLNGSPEELLTFLVEKD